jgi:hypothetical protein
MAEIDTNLDFSGLAAKPALTPVWLSENDSSRIPVAFVDGKPIKSKMSPRRSILPPKNHNDGLDLDPKSFRL